MKNYLVTFGLLILCTVGSGAAADADADGSAALQLATFAGGCFWCMEQPFEALPGVVSVTSGYTGGHVPSPSYAEVSTGGTGHAEAVEIRFDPTQISYATLLQVFWRNIDPTDAGGQFSDRGSQYRSAIFYHSAEQQRLAEASKAQLAASGRFRELLVTEIVSATTFYPAEGYHQDYYRNNPLRYRIYRAGSGRDQFLDHIWGKERAAGNHD